ncbi:hypothetical protein HAX54_004604, partial [Datura stramonium]|nr:hypothetical protein [Datura stramonium]
ALMNTEKHEIMFQVNNESMTFKAKRGCEMPNGCKSITLSYNGIWEVDDKKGQANHGFKDIPKKKKEKRKW